MPIAGEFSLIRWIRSQASKHPSVPIGIGDDCAAVRIGPGQRCVVTSDMLLDGVHFDSAVHTMAQIGHKALAVSLSDIAAVAAQPLACFCDVAIPTELSEQNVHDFFGGLLKLCSQFNLTLAGGDTNQSPDRLVVSTTVLGEVHSANLVTRSGAQAGDLIVVTGTLGGSLSGKHIDFSPRVLEAQQINAAYQIHAMMDISDGLASDLGHLSAESGVSACLHSEQIPISAAARQAQGPLSPLEHALYDGEDFELLMTLDPQAARRLCDQPPCETELRVIGEIEVGDGVWLQRGHQKTRLASKGYDHFPANP